MLIYQQHSLLHRTGTFLVRALEWVRGQHLPYRLAKCWGHCSGLAPRKKTPTYLLLSRMLRNDLGQASLNRKS